MTRDSEQDRNLEDRLRDLWWRRPVLSEREWGELYGIIVGILWTRCSELVAQLPGSREDYIQDFFEDKVLSLGNPGNALHHAGALVVYYRRYLLGCLREPEVRDVVRQPVDEAQEGVGTTLLDQALARQAMDAAASDDPAVLRDLVDWVANAVGGLIPGAACPAAPAEAQGLISQYVGVDLAQAVGSAVDFLRGRGDWSQLAGDAWWIRLYLRCHFCPGQPDAVALNTLARKHQIPSYHYKAVALGVTVPKQQGAALAAFRRSYRGQWLVRLGIAVDPEHLLEMSLALKVLCLVALSPQEPGEWRCPPSVDPTPT